ncbi:MAG: hypothetical protein JW751_07645 [Polyangiaceae bacterium]|nr:hypothetical protein [Polyangiaceae bacterium]
MHPVEIGRTRQPDSPHPRSGRARIAGIALAVFLSSPEVAAQTSASFPEVPDQATTPPPPTSPGTGATAPVSLSSFPAPSAPVPGLGGTPPAGPGAADLGVWVPPSVSAPPAPLGPGYLPYHRGLEVPPGYHLRYRPARGLLISGATTLSLSYIVALAMLGGRDLTEKDGALAIPIIGPWITTTAKKKNPCSSMTITVTNNSAIVAQEANTKIKACVKKTVHAGSRIAVVVADGVIQAFGAALLLAGAAGGQKELERDDLKKVKVRPLAVAGEGGGLSMELAF